MPGDLNLGAQLVYILDYNITKAATGLESARSADDRVTVDVAILRQPPVFRLIGKVSN